jgi:hypothetical protein
MGGGRARYSSKSSSTSTVAELDDEACRDAASASCRDLLVHDA